MSSRAEIGERGKQEERVVALGGRRLVVATAGAFDHRVRFEGKRRSRGSIWLGVPLTCG